VGVTEHEQRLVAILAADAAGYSRLMAADDHATVAALDAARSVFRSHVESNHGRVVDVAGDSVLAVFKTAAGAIAAALAVQQELETASGSVPEERRMRFRIGVHLGDVIEKVDGTVYGDGVNIAARLQGLAEAGGVAVSDAVKSALRGKVPVAFEDRGEQTVKNAAEPVRVFGVKPVDGPKAKPTSMGSVGIPPIPEKPSIAVLPFQNMSGDREQEYFADGMVEEIITALSRVRSLFVIARNSSFVYKGKAVDVKQVARELGVRYVLEGSVRKAGNRVRITGQLIEASTGTHIWADRFDGGLEDVFDLQDEIAASVVGAVLPTLEQAEIERSKRKSTESLDAYDHYLRGLASLYQFRSRESSAEALRLFERAIELDSEFASAYAAAAVCYTFRKAESWVADPATEAAETTRLARRAVELSKDDSLVLGRSGFALAVVVCDLESGATLVDRALALNPNLAIALYWGGWIKIWLGEPEMAIARLAHAMRLSPLDPRMALMQAAMAHGHFFAGRYDEASSWAMTSLQGAPSHPHGLRIHAASSALAGQMTQAQKSMKTLLERAPTQRVSNLNEVFGPYRRREDVAKYTEGLRRAGLPE
jgi:TolB-like protein/class 3 adenylate cyclase/Tfp pilus assembly protein PilF